ncbi:hypothetical protein B0H13DRAFT_1903659 [Mycena leptocephala]|nr:hypothetical protein B0H13DRAFT_1903659 [Mycena leptocephala]
MIEFPVTFGDDEYGCPNAQLFPRTTHNLKLESPQKIEPPTYIAGIHEIAQSRKSGCEISMQIPTPRKAGGPNIAQMATPHRSTIPENLVDVILLCGGNSYAGRLNDLETTERARRYPRFRADARPTCPRFPLHVQTSMRNGWNKWFPQSDLTAENCAAANKENGEVITKDIEYDIPGDNNLSPTDFITSSESLGERLYFEPRKMAPQLADQLSAHIRNIRSLTDFTQFFRRYRKDATDVGKNLSKL